MIEHKETIIIERDMLETYNRLLKDCAPAKCECEGDICNCMNDIIESWSAWFGSDFRIDIIVGVAKCGGWLCEAFLMRLYDDTSGEDVDIIQGVRDISGIWSFLDGEEAFTATVIAG